eukprot:tig00020746_g13649.t1
MHSLQRSGFPIAGSPDAELAAKRPRVRYPTPPLPESATDAAVHLSAPQSAPAAATAEFVKPTVASVSTHAEASVAPALVARVSDTISQTLVHETLTSGGTFSVYSVPKRSGQDAFRCVEKMNNHADMALFGIYDGHGRSRAVADFTANGIVEHLAHVRKRTPPAWRPAIRNSGELGPQSKHFPENILMALRHAYLSTDMHLKKEAPSSPLLRLGFV